MRISDWSSDVCSDLAIETLFAASHGSLRIESVRSKFKGSLAGVPPRRFVSERKFAAACATRSLMIRRQARITTPRHHRRQKDREDGNELDRSEEHTSELQSLMRISYAVFCLKKKKKTIKN